MKSLAYAKNVKKIISRAYFYFIFDWMFGDYWTELVWVSGVLFLGALRLFIAGQVIAEPCCTLCPCCFTEIVKF